MKINHIIAGLLIITTTIFSATQVVYFDQLPYEGQKTLLKNLSIKEQLEFRALSKTCNLLFNTTLDNFDLSKVDNNPVAQCLYKKYCIELFLRKPVVLCENNLNKITEILSQNSKSQKKFFQEAYLFFFKIPEKQGQKIPTPQLKKGKFSTQVIPFLTFLIQENKHLCKQFLKFIEQYSQVKKLSMKKEDLLNIIDTYLLKNISSTVGGYLEPLLNFFTHQKDWETITKIGILLTKTKYDNINVTVLQSLKRLKRLKKSAFYAFDNKNNDFCCQIINYCMIKKKDNTLENILTLIIAKIKDARLGDNKSFVKSILTLITTNKKNQEIQSTISESIMTDLAYLERVLMLF